MNTTITHTTRTFPQLPYEVMKDDILGKSYNLTLVFVGERRARMLNEAHRKKSYVPNVLSFPLTPSAGEIYIAPKVAEKEAHKFDMTPLGYIGYLFIHGLLHLKGYPHGDTMEKAEKKFVSKYKLK